MARNRYSSGHCLKSLARDGDRAGRRCSGRRGGTSCWSYGQLMARRSDNPGHAVGASAGRLIGCARKPDRSVRRRRSRAAHRRQGPALHGGAHAGRGVPHPPRRDRPRRRDRAAGGQRGQVHQRRPVPGAAPAARRLRDVDAARRAGDLPQGRRADRARGRHLPRRPGAGGRRRVGRADLLAAARGRARGPGGVLRGARRPRRARVAQRRDLLRRAARRTGSW